MKCGITVRGEVSGAEVVVALAAVVGVLFVAEKVSVVGAVSGR